MHFRSLLKISSSLNYALLATVTSFVVFTGAVWFPNIKLIGQIFTTESISFVDTLVFLWSLYGSVATNFTGISLTYTILISLLFGVQVMLLTHYVSRVRVKNNDNAKIGKIGVTSLGGLIAGTFGIGCAACGTFILTSTLTLFGATGVLAYLPFGGEEFGFLGVALLLYANYLILVKINEPLVCKV